MSSRSSATRASRVKHYKRSRNGCRNCKLRSVKCDETHPQCGRCQSYAIVCNFANDGPDLQLAAAGAQSHFESWSQTSQPTVLSLLPRREDMFLVKFQSDVAMTISFGKRLALFQNEIVTLSDSYSFLRHAILSLTMMHERHKAEWEGQDAGGLKQIRPQRDEEVSHWYLATCQFNQHFASTLALMPRRNPGVRQQAALSATSALLVVLSFCYVEARTPDEAWPMSEDKSAADELAWIKLSNGKLAAQTSLQDLAVDPAFRALVHVDPQDTTTRSLDMSAVFDTGYDSLLELDQSSYGVEVESLMNVRDSNSLLVVVFAFWSFIGGMTADFERSLRLKEPAALTILLYWYAKLNLLPVWWLKARTTLEGQAICKYLDRRHSQDAMVKRLLYWPTSILCPT